MPVFGISCRAVLLGSVSQHAFGLRDVEAVRDVSRHKLPGRRTRKRRFNNKASGADSVY